MARSNSHPRSARFGASLVLLAAAAMAAGCGKSTPVGPLGNSSVGGSSPIEARKPVDFTMRALAALAPGTDPAAVAADIGAKLVSAPGFDLAVFEPLGKETALELSNRLSVDSRVAGAEPDGLFEAPEGRQVSVAFDDGGGTPDQVTSQPSTLSAGFATAHLISQGAGVRVAVLDTGVDPTHPMLSGRIAGSWDFVEGDGDPTDVGNGKDDDRDGIADESAGHGTHVAGIIAAGSPQSDLLIARVLDADGRGDFANVAAGIRWAQSQGARVINLSLGGVTGSNAVQDALEAAEDAGIVCIASAGNWGSDNPEEFPAKSSHAVAVAAVDAAGSPASFSSFGGFVAMSAPGVAVRSAYLGGRYASWSGTSMAAPFVSATAALLLSVHPDWNQELVMARIRATGSPVVTTNPNLQDKFGAGVVNAAAALSSTTP